ncbi:ead/Ea22-like family protein [Enterobacter hormaechei subsp. xiangfangensis]|nr:ead/Ea22-like family protein [Enterobacter hormaechei]MBG0593867.1 ead/Ea22-like family protein [Enterobacter hormaechei]MBT2045105.1 ead/Ea22-like family protein [Enterobacter hormaechei subsp. xiangfangensis]MBT2094855.1 ead/Ea22-like family protein [Enterobacter hormaechei subsp. xiangfangensis]
MFAYAVQVAVLELRKVRNEAAALAAENAGLKNAITAVSKTSEECEINGDELKYVVEPSEFDALTDLLDETPVTNAFMAEMRAQAHKEGAHFVANRMLAAWEAGFIDDTAKNAADIARMILISTEFMADAPEGDFDRSFADGVLEDIAAQLRKGVLS